MICKQDLTKEEQLFSVPVNNMLTSYLGNRLFVQNGLQPVNVPAAEVCP